MKTLIITLIYSFLIFTSTATYSQECYDSSILSPTPFMGNNDEVFKLSDGSIWEVKYEYEYLYEYYPTVTVCPEREFLIINNKKLNIKLLSESSASRSSNTSASSTPDFIESRIDGNFKGYNYENIYRLRNGQIWEQTSYRYRYRYRYAPTVMIINRNGSFQLQVDGMKDWVTVTRLR